MKNLELNFSIINTFVYSICTTAALLLTIVNAANYKYAYIMKFVTIVIILLLHLSAVAQLKVSIYGHLTQVTNIGTLSLDGINPFTESPISAGNGNGPVYRATVTAVPPFALYRNGMGMSGIGASAIYPVSSVNGTLHFYGEVNTTGYFSVRYVYQMVAPNKVTSSMDGVTQTCANMAITLRSADNWPLFGDDVLTPRIIWEYDINGNNTWQPFDSSSASYTLNFVPILKLPVGSVSNFRFRCRMKAAYPDKVYYSPYSTASDYYTIIPSPPATSLVQVRPSCAGMNNGRIHISGNAIRSSFPLMRWILRPGTVTGPCDGNCGDMIEWSDGADSVSKGVDIRELPPGNYTLWLLNPGGTAGNCLSAIKVTIPEVPALSIYVAGYSDITCYAAANGFITLGAKGGSGYHYTLKTPAGDTLHSEYGTFVWLGPGEYLGTVTDTACGGTASMRITLTGPPPLSLQVVATSPICSTSPDGSIVVTTTGDRISLYRDTMQIPNFSGLVAGHYKVKVSDGCTSKDTSMVLDRVAPLSLDLLKNDTISCFGNNTGHLEFAAKGGMGHYRYTLSGNITHTNTTGDFNDLPAGVYTIAVNNDTTGCDDIVTQQVVVYQNPPVQVQIVSTPITCYNAENGSLLAIVTGGSGVYNYRWEKDDWFSTDPYIDQLGPGTYRLQVTSNCPTVSDTISFTNPPLLSIDSISLHDATCLEDGASFDIMASGGDGQYTYAISSDHGETYTGYNTIHIPGEYNIMVTDGHGCMAWAPGNYTISLPEKLELTTHTKNITCTGNNDGQIEICARGGEGDYTYGMISIPEHASPIFDSLFAGDYQLFVTDNRGCKKTTTVHLSEDSSLLPLSISAATSGVYCATDLTGAITLTASGGKLPYTYTLDNTTWQRTPLFSGLAAGYYVARVKDSAGCRSKYAADIISRDPAIYLSPSITPVRCFGEASGAVNVTATGGDGLFSYQWDHTPQNVSAGIYHLIVTDGKGCSRSAAYEVPEPPLLTMQIENTPTCDGLSEGQLNIQAQGGQPGYTYAINDDWTDTPVFKHLSAGTYPVIVRDANGCAVQNNISITVKNTKPDINFLVVSQDHVSDTIAVREICLPAPDAVVWAFSPSTRYLGDDPFGAPLIRFSREGDYWVQLSATFGTCTYTLKKDLSILPYDPENLPVYQLPANIIEAVSLSPNPNQGHFNFNMHLRTKQQVQVFVYDLNGHLLGRKQYQPALLIEDYFDLDNVLPGIYLFRILTEKDSRDVPFIISQF
jgi:hypothetical protein